MDGKYLITTSDPHISAEDTAVGYKSLLEAKRGFRDLGSALLLRPVLPRLEHPSAPTCCCAGVRRCSSVSPNTAPAQAVADAVLAIIEKVGQFRGESRFATWAYKFVIFEVSGKIGRHFWRTAPVSLEAQD